MTERTLFFLKKLSKSEVEYSLLREFEEIWEALRADLALNLSPEVWKQDLDLIREERYLRQPNLKCITKLIALQNKSSWRERLIQVLEYHISTNGTGVTAEDLQRYWMLLFDVLYPWLGIGRTWQKDGADALASSIYYIEVGLQHEVTPHSSPVLLDDWKTFVRIKQTLADASALAKDMNRSPKRAFSKWWLYTLEVLLKAEKQRLNGDLSKVELSRFEKIRVAYQALFGRMTFR